MKKICLILFLVLGLTSCDWLDVIPEGKASFDDLFATRFQADAYACSLYYYTHNRWYFQYNWEATGCDIISGSYGQPSYWKWKSMVYDNLETPSTTYIAMWSHSATSYPSGYREEYIWEGVRVAYDILENADSVPDATEDDKNLWKGEAYWLIAYQHQTLLEFYGPVVIVDHRLSASEDCNDPRSPYLDCVQFISDMYDKAAELLPDNHDTTNYGRATKTCALTLKARAWLFAASPLINGNTEYYSNFVNKDGTHLIPQEYDPELWKKAMDAADEAITHGESCGYGIYTSPDYGNSDFDHGYNSYRAAFLGEEGSSSSYNWAETLFGLNYQSNIRYNLRNMTPRVGYSSYNSSGFRGHFNPTFEAAEIFYTENGLPIDVDPLTKDQGDARYKVAAGDSTALLHRHREPRFYACIGFDRGDYDVNGGTITLKVHRGEEQQNDGVVSHEYQTNTGYFVKKWTCKIDTYNVSSESYTYHSHPYPYIRFTELYLNYAEAEAEYTGTLSAKGLEYINKVRRRAGIPDLQDSWALVGGLPSGQDLVDIIRQERMIEFIFEGRWYHDLRRWKLAEEWYMRSQRSWNLEGTTTEDFYNVVDFYEGSQVRTFYIPRNIWAAIPQDQININPNLVQNPGYTGGASM